MAHTVVVKEDREPTPSHAGPVEIAIVLGIVGGVQFSFLPEQLGSLFHWIAAIVMWGLGILLLIAAALKEEDPRGEEDRH